MQYVIVLHTFFYTYTCRSERQKKLLPKETGVTEHGGQFDQLKTFNAIE
jgi:hypothetical protein